VQPDQCYLVVDGMTGQDAVNSAAAFNKALELDGVVMTKLDGDARGGALLSVREVTGVPVKFIGTGEGLDGLEPFRPEGMSERILGMGDIVGLVQTAQQEFDREEAQKAEERLKSGEFTLDDFRKQLSQIEKPGLMQKMLGMMPGMGQIKEMMGGADGADEIKQLRGIIDSMTLAERRNPRGTIDPSRRVRIANGAGVQPQQVNELVKQYDGMKSMMEKMAGKGMRERMQMMQEMQSGGMLDPAGKIKTEKQSTGKRLSGKERAKLRKQRDKELRRKKREARKKK